MHFESWQACYASDAQGVWALLPIPTLFLLWWLVAGPRASSVSDPALRFTARWAPLFAILTLLDPLVSGLLSRALGLEGSASLALLIPFVLLGDFRIYWLLFALGDPEPRARAAAASAARWTLLVPIIAVALFFGAVRGIAPDAPGQGIWLVYELAFCGVALWLRQRWLPARESLGAARARCLRQILAFALLYYALWALCDIGILFFSLDAAWALRTLPNQLYYSFTVPCVWLAVRRASTPAPHNG